MKRMSILFLAFVGMALLAMDAKSFELALHLGRSPQFRQAAFGQHYVVPSRAVFAQQYHAPQAFFAPRYQAPRALFAPSYAQDDCGVSGGTGGTGVPFQAPFFAPQRSYGSYGSGLQLNIGNSYSPNRLLFQRALIQQGQHHHHHH